MSYNTTSKNYYMSCIHANKDGKENMMSKIYMLPKVYQLAREHMSKCINITCSNDIIIHLRIIDVAV